MKRRTLLVGIASLFLSVLPTFGQAWETKATINVPFEFVVGGTVLPAGDYAVLTATTTPTFLLIKNVQTGASAIPQCRKIVISPIGSTVPTSKFVFNSDGHVLHQVALWEDNHVHDLIHGTDVAELPGTKR